MADDAFKHVSAAIAAIVIVLLLTGGLSINVGEADCTSCDWKGDWEECVQKTIVKIENRTDPLWDNVYQVDAIYTAYCCPDCGEIIREEFVSETRKI